MLTTGIPELKNVDSIEWLSDTLVLDKTDEEAAKIFSGLIETAITSKATKLNNLAHKIAQNMG